MKDVEREARKNKKRPFSDTNSGVVEPERKSAGSEQVRAVPSPIIKEEVKGMESQPVCSDRPVVPQIFKSKLREKGLGLRVALPIRPELPTGSVYPSSAVLGCIDFAISPAH